MKVIFKEKQNVAEGMLYITFSTINEDLNFRAGQFCRLTLVNPPYSDNRGNSRILGFTTSPSLKDSFSILTKEGVSAFKKSLAQMKPGDAAEIGEYGGLISLPQDVNQKLVFIAGNIGVAPVLAVLRHCREINWPYKITLIYVNDKLAKTPFLEMLGDFAKESDRFTLINTITDDPLWTGEKRNVTSELIKELIQNPQEYLYFITGVTTFCPTIFKELLKCGVDTTKIKMEIFTGY